MTHVTCRLTAKHRDQLRNPTLCSRVCATATAQRLSEGVKGKSRPELDLPFLGRLLGVQVPSRCPVITTGRFDVEIRRHLQRFCRIVDIDCGCRYEALIDRVCSFQAGSVAMAAYRPVYDSRHLQADCQEPGSARELYAR